MTTPSFVRRLRRNQQSLLEVAARDLTEPRDAGRIVRTIRDAAIDLRRPSSLRQVADAVVRRMGEVVGTVAIRLFVVKGTDLELLLAPRAAASAAPPDVGRAVLRAMTTGEVAADEGPEPADEGGGAAVERSVAVPMVAGGVTVGVVEIVGIEPDEDATAALVAIARLGADALSRNRTHSEHAASTSAATDASRRIERLRTVTVALSHPTAAQEIAQVAVDALVETLGASIGLCHVLDAEDGRLHLAYARGYPVGLTERDAVISVDALHPAARALRDGEVVVERPEAWRTEFPGASDLLAMTGAGSLAGLRFGDARPIGTIVVLLPRAGRLADAERTYLDTIGRLTGQAMDRAAHLEREQEARLLQEAFVGVVSHELRTPITTLLAGSKLLARDKSLEPTARGLALDLEAEADRLYRLAEDLLVLTRLERGNLSTEAEPVHLERLAERVVRSEKGRWPTTRIEVRAEPHLPLAQGEETYVEQVMRNLVTNAAKYGPADGTVEVVLESTASEVLVRVHDEGPGIDSGEIGQLFTLFYRSPKTAAAASGAGIGLYVCDRLVRAMGGRTFARRRPERGSEFGFSLVRYRDESDDDLGPYDALDIDVLPQAIPFPIEEPADELPTPARRR